LSWLLDRLAVSAEPGERRSRLGTR
jgi:hypothetical protein